MQLVNGTRIIERSPLAKLAAWKLGTSNVALTLGSSIHLHNASTLDFLSNEKWVKHELAHVAQFRKYGFLRFIFLYALESIRRGYYNNRFEVEARESEEA